MAVPANLTSVALSGDARSLLATWVPADTTETGFKVRWSFDDGSTWTDPLVAPAGATSATYHSPAQSVNAKVEVLPFNGDGDAAAASVSTAVATGVLAEAAGGTKVWLYIGESAANPRALNVGALTAVSATAINNINAIAQIKKEVDDAQRYNWPARNNPLALPSLSPKAFIWNHVGLTATITAIAPNTPSAGTTEVTFSGSIGRPINHEFWARFKSTGVANMDNVELKVKVTASNKVQIASFTASTSASTGTMDLPSFDNYDSDQNGDTNFRNVGAYPSTTWGIERSFLAEAQDSTDGILGDGTNAPHLMVRVADPSPILSRLVASSSTTKRWSKRLSGKSYSVFDVMSRVFADAHEFAVKIGASSTPAPFTIGGIVLSAGYNEASQNVAQILATHSISAVSVSGGGVVTITTSAGHGVSNESGKLYALARFDGIGGTLGTALNGKILPINVTTSTQFEVLDFDGTGLSGTVTSGQSKVTTGSPMFFLREILAEHVDDIRAAAVDAFDSSQDPEDVPVVLWEPSYGKHLDAFEAIFSPTVKAQRDIVWGQFRADMRTIAGEKPNVRTLNAEDYDRITSGGGLTEDGIFFSGRATLDIGLRAYGLLSGSIAAESAKPTPAVVGIIIGDSYVQGTTPEYLGKLRNREVVAPESSLAGNLGDPIEWLKVYNQSTEAIETLVVDPSLDLAYGGRSNTSTNPKLNIGQSNRAGIHVAAARELRLAFPDHDIVLFCLGVDGSTATAHANSVGTSGAKIKAVTPGATSTTIELEAPGLGGSKIYRTKPFNVSISGVTGLTPSIDGARLATPIEVDTNPVTRGTQKFTIPIGSTGTAGVSSAFVQLPQTIWDPNSNDAWAEIVEQVPKFHAAMRAANLHADARFAFVLLGTNDAALAANLGNVTPADYTAAIGRIKTGLREQFETRTKPGKDLAIVFLAPIKHGRATIPTATIGQFQQALAAAISGDTRAIVLNVDETADRLEDAVTIDADRIHPDTNGYVQLGYRLARRLQDVPAWDATFDLTAGGSGATGGVEVVTP